MYIAIVIGVSKYSNPKDNLPGSKNDAESINQILRKTEKFTDVLYINNEENSATTKELITNFISAHKGKNITEFFFYYSGHGEFSNDEFYYVLSDFDSKKRNQTSLQNKEIDDLIKTLNPSIVIKVIDACQSGTFYIKEIGVLNKYFYDSQRSFQKCYFLNSSLNSQSSFADQKISFFTASFISAIKEHKSKEIRYKDIIDVISDEFSGNQDQTPLFVIQADLTEKFCLINDELKAYVSTIIETEGASQEEESKSLTLADLIKIDAQDYIDKEGVITALNKIKKEFEGFNLNKNLEELYSIHIEFLHEHEGIIKLNTIKKWLDDNEHDYFVTSVYEDKYDDIIGPYESLVGFDLHIEELPFVAVSIELKAKYPNILSYHSNIVYFISKKSIRFFYFTTNYVDKNWDLKELNTKSIKWFTTEHRIGVESEILKGVKHILNTIQNQIEKDLEEKFKPDEDTNPEDDDLPF